MKDKRAVFETSGYVEQAHPHVFASHGSRHSEIASPDFVYAQSEKGTNKPRSISHSFQGLSHTEKVTLVRSNLSISVLRVRSVTLGLR
jgi:hypothetical protein